MTLVAQRAGSDTSVIASGNPLAALLGATLISAASLVHRDLTTELLLLVPAGLTWALTGLGPRAMLVRTWPVLVGAFFVSASNAVLAPGPGLAVESAATIGLRTIVLALPGVLVLAATDPTDLADALVQRLHVSARFAYGALAALRLAPLLAQEWRVLGLAQRARGVDAGRNPLTGVRLAGRRGFTLLVGSLRRATRLALAMDARGFDSDSPRTFARDQPWQGRDTVLIGATLAVLAVVAATSYALQH